MSVEPLAPSPGRARLARDGLATAPPGITYAGDRPIEVTLLTITDVGRQALGDMWAYSPAGCYDWTNRYPAIK